jgi:hypothetical protein
MYTLKRLLSLIGLLGTAVQISMASPAPAADKPPLPADLYFDSKPIPPEQNAIVNWQRAGEVEVIPNDKEKQLLEFCWTPEAREPSADELNDLRNWLKRNREALELFDASLVKPKAQWPKRGPQDQMPELLADSYLIRARLFAADQLAEQGNFEAAAKSLEDSLKLAQMGIESEPATIHYLTASNVRTFTQDAILRLACRKQVPLPVLERLLNDLPSLDSETNAYARVLQLGITSQYNSTIDLKQLAADWSKDSASNAISFMFPPDFIRPFKVLIDPSLVPMHPKPLDGNAVIERKIHQYRIYRTNSYSAWSARSSAVEVEDEENRTNLLRDIAPLMELVENEPLPLGRQAAQRARTAYLGIENPIGRIWDCRRTPFVGTYVRVFRVRTEREATRAVLALLIFERKKGVLPAKLSDLVAEKLLKSVPSDPFSSGKILYSRERRIVWSVGENGKDDKGDAGEFRWSGDDVVWSIPAIN